MHYKFPVINHINDVLPHVKDRKEFVVAERDGFTVINYVVQTGSTFDRDNGWEVRRECRGIIFCNETGKVISRPAHKFFNVSEREETDIHNIDISQDHIILDKLDGSFIRPFRTADGVMRVGTKMGETEIADMAKPFFEKENYKKFAEWCCDNDLTPVFEFMSRKNRIVIDYGEEDQLVLLFMRHNTTGEYLPYNEMVKAKTHGIEVVEAHEATFSVEFLDYVHGLSGVEGFVVRFDDGHMVKIKCLEYLKFHRAMDSIIQEKNVWSMIIDEQVDDIKSFLPEDDRGRVEEFEDRLWKAIDKRINNTESVYIAIMAKLNNWDFSMFDDPGRERQKMFATEFAVNYDSPIKSLLFEMYAGSDSRTVVMNWLRKNLSTKTKLDSIRLYFGNISFDALGNSE